MNADSIVAPHGLRNGAITKSFYSTTSIMYAGIDSQISSEPLAELCGANTAAERVRSGSLVVKSRLRKKPRFAVFRTAKPQTAVKTTKKRNHSVNESGAER